MTPGWKSKLTHTPEPGASVFAGVAVGVPVGWAAAAGAESPAGAGLEAVVVGAVGTVGTVGTDGTFGFLIPGICAVVTGAVATLKMTPTTTHQERRRIGGLRFERRATIDSPEWDFARGPVGGR